MSWSTLRYNFVNLLQFHNLFSFIFHFGVFTIAVGIGNCPELRFNPQPLNSVQTFKTSGLTDPWAQLALRTNFLQILQFHHLFSEICHFGLRLCQSPHLLELKFCWWNHMSVAEWIQDTNVTHHWRILWSSYKKLDWEGFEHTTTEFRSDVLTDWPIRTWVHPH